MPSIRLAKVPVPTAEIADDAVTDAKIASHTTTKITVPKAMLSGVRWNVVTAGAAGSVFDADSVRLIFTYGVS